MNTNPFKLQIPVYLLAGGRSTRFGQDKARTRLGAHSLLELVAQQIYPFASSITVIAAQGDQYLDLGFRTLADRHPHLGPLSGLERALEDCRSDWLLLGSCDTLGIQFSEISTLLQAPRKGKQAIAWWRDFWEPLWALYHKSLVTEVPRRLAAQQLSMQALLDHVSVNALSNPPLNWLQVNTPEDWQQAQMRLQQKKSNQV